MKWAQGAGVSNSISGLTVGWGYLTHRCFCGRVLEGTGGFLLFGGQSNNCLREISTFVKHSQLVLPKAACMLETPQEL